MVQVGAMKIAFGTKMNVFQNILLQTAMGKSAIQTQLV
jgi:hypothetical protein